MLLQPSPSSTAAYLIRCNIHCKNIAIKTKLLDLQWCSENCTGTERINTSLNIFNGGSLSYCSQLFESDEEVLASIMVAFIDGKPLKYASKHALSHVIFTHEFSICFEVCTITVNNVMAEDFSRCFGSSGLIDRLLPSALTSLNGTVIYFTIDLLVTRIREHSNQCTQKQIPSP